MTLPSTEHLLIPIVVGITGHRDIAEVSREPVKNELTRIITELHAKYPNSPLLVLTSLAEGADRIGAEVAIDLGVEFAVPLPLPIHEYEKDFGTLASIDEFRELLSKAKTYFHVSGEETENYHTESDVRSASYMDASRFIGRHCHVLVAMWDGIDSGRVGGTSHLVEMKLNGKPLKSVKESPLLESLEAGSVFHIHTPRTSKQHQVSTTSLLPAAWSGQPESHSIQDSILFNTDRYNRDVIDKLKMPTPDHDWNSAIVSEELTKETPDNSQTMNRHSTASNLANAFKRKRTREIGGLLTLAVVAFFFLQLYAEFFHTWPVLLFYPLLLGIASGLYIYAKKRRHEVCHEDYRALAEALRVQYFWRLCGITERVEQVYLTKHVGELEWIRYALRIWNSPIWSDATGNSDSAVADHAAVTSAMRNWVSKQKEWFTLRTSQELLRESRHKRLTDAFFAAGIGVALVLLFSDVCGVADKFLSAEATDLIHKFAIVTIAMMLSISAAIHGYAEKLLHSEQAKQYARMAFLHGTAESRIRWALKNGNPSGAKKLLTELGRACLSDTEEWLLLHRSRPLEMPKA